MDQGRVAIVGAGIVGLAHAWSAAERGFHVTIFDRGKRASGASIRNFGMIWPLGQPAGECRDLALASRDRWLRLADIAGIWVSCCGSIHLAHRDDEWSVLQEFEAQAAGLGYECSLWTPAQVQQCTPAVNPTGLLGGLFSPTELCVNPRKAVHQLTTWLAQQLGVRVMLGEAVTDIRTCDRGGAEVHVSRGKTERFDHVVVCGGHDFETLFPSLFASRQLTLCKLQMLKTIPQSAGWRLGCHVASGLTLRHYRNFEICPSLRTVRERIASETPELDRFGIHVMAAQNDEGEIILGDSHEYDEAIQPFDKVEVDELILRELRKVIRLPDWTVSERWHGVNAKSLTGPCFEAEPLPNVRICTATGGAGMTMAFGIAERAWRRWINES